MTLTVEAIKNGSFHIKPGTAPAAKLVCKVERTRCPVKAALTAKEPVSLSLIADHDNIRILPDQRP